MPNAETAAPVADKQFVLHEARDDPTHMPLVESAGPGRIANGPIPAGLQEQRSCQPRATALEDGGLAR